MTGALIRNGLKTLCLECFLEKVSNEKLDEIGMLQVILT